MIGPLLLGIFGTLPGIPALTAGSGEASRVHWTQIFGLLFAALVPLGALILMLATGLDVDGVVRRRVGRHRERDRARPGTHVAARRPGPGAHRAARPRSPGGDGRALERRRDARRPDRSRQLCQPRPAGDARLQPARAGSAGTCSTSSPTRSAQAAIRQFERLVEFGNGGTVEFEATLLHADGQHRKATVVVANLVGGAAVDGIVATFRDVTEQRNLERQLSHRAFHDELTGLANRALFLDRMDHALRVARPEADPVVVLFVDLDDFKSVNDALGHAVGDQLLKTVADRIRRAAGTGDTAARLGGDEFAILLEDRGGIDRAIDVAERLLDSLRDPVSIAGYDVAVLASVGVAVASPGMSTTSLLRDADIAMYEAKRAGKGQIRIFDPAMRLVATKHLEYRSDLGEALERGQLRLVYMPFVDLRSGQVRRRRGARALAPPAARRHPRQRVRADRRALRSDRADGLLGARAGAQPGRRLAARSCSSASTCRRCRSASPTSSSAWSALVDEYHVDPQTVMFELTETVLVDEGDRATETVTRLREEGFRFAIDDFGAGYCSLSYLQRHPVDLLKIDRTAIDEFGQRPARQHARPHDPADGRLARPAARSPRASRPPSSSASCAASAATSARATCCRARSRRTPSPAASATPTPSAAPSRAARHGGLLGAPDAR